MKNNVRHIRLIWTATLLAAGALARLPFAAAVESKEKPKIEWVRIPGGVFMMGKAGEPNTQPVHRVAVKSFQMAKTLVTNAQYKACVDSGVCSPPRDFGVKFRGADQPVVGVDWKQARSFSRWVGGRLPSEAEWEYAARSAGKDRDYPWGNENATCETAVISGCSSSVTLPVCSAQKGSTEQGLCDMAGNVYEWVEDPYHSSYKGAPNDGHAWGGAGAQRVVRGGAWSLFTSFVRASTRDRENPSERANILGFRPARD